MPESKDTIFIVDDDPEMCNSLQRLFESVNLPTQTYLTADEFLGAYNPQSPGCLILDIRMPGMSGMELQEKLQADGIEIPIIVITAHGDIPMAVQAMKNGAIDFIEKPFRAQPLLDRVQQALEDDARKRWARAEREALNDQLQKLTKREREIMELLVTGKSSKEIANQLSISRNTVDIHRAHIMQKMGIETITELVIMMHGNHPDKD